MLPDTVIVLIMVLVECAIVELTPDVVAGSEVLAAVVGVVDVVMFKLQDVLVAVMVALAVAR